MAFNDTHRAVKDLGVKDGDIISFAMADNIKIYKGDYVVANAAGYADCSAPAAGDTFLGVAYETVDNTLTGHVVGGKEIRLDTKRGRVHKFYKSSPVVDDVGLKAFSSVAVDAQTVISAASTSGTHAVGIGLIVDFDATAGTVDVAIEPGFDIAS